MKSVLLNVIRILESIFLGVMIVYISTGIAGGIYEIVREGPSDGFLFNLLFLGGPFLFAAFLGISIASWKSIRSRKFFRWMALGLVILIVCIVQINRWKP